MVLLILLLLRKDNIVSDLSNDLGINSQLPLSIGNAVDSNGSPVDTTGVLPVWSSSDEGSLTLSDQADGSTLAVRAIKSAGSAVVTATITNADGSTATSTISISFADLGGGTSGSIASFDIVPGVPS
jgi:VCBS repeat-containing protein